MIMREEIANLVYPIINYGLQLKEQLERGGEMPDVDNEQAALKGLLGNESSARRWADFGGEGSSLETSLHGGVLRSSSDPGRRSDGFQGIRYILACWLDEIMIDSLWEAEWRERTLEHALYSTRDRAWKFWEQARRAETRPGSDALEVIFLCVMLGFRGDLREDPDKLRNWVSTIQTRIAQSQGREWPAPDGQEPVTNVPPLRGQERLQRMILAWGGAVLVGILLGTFILISWLWES
jgi:type VI secretion system protein ImpK